MRSSTPDRRWRGPSRTARGVAVAAALAVAISILAAPSPLAAQAAAPDPGARESGSVPAAEARTRPAALELSLPVRQTFTLLDASLHIEVVGEAPGELRVVRGGGGRVRVHALASGGLATASLADHRGPGTGLKLTSLDARRVLYLVEVPSEALVRVRLPGRRTPSSLGVLDEMETYRWEG